MRTMARRRRRVGRVVLHFLFRSLFKGLRILFIVFAAAAPGLPPPPPPEPQATVEESDAAPKTPEAP